MLSMVLYAVCTASLILMLSTGMMFTPSFAHTTIAVGKYDVEAGWDVEPPIVGLRNSVVISVVERGDIEGQSTGVTHVFRGVEAEVFFGGESKVLSFNSDAMPGSYYSPIIPTRTGTYLVQITGDIRGTPVDIQIPIEDVEHTAALDFPSLPAGNTITSSGSSQDASDIEALKKSIARIQSDISKLESGETEVLSTDDGMTYNFAVLGLSMSAVAIVLGVLSLTRKPVA